MTKKSIILTAKVLVAMGLVVGGLLGGVACTKEVIKEVPKEVIKEVPKEVIKEVPKEVIKEVIKEVPKEVVKEVPMNLTATAKAVKEGKIDVGKAYGLGLDERYHKVHSTVLGLECDTCHIGKPDTTQTVFSGQDVSPQSPGPVDKKACLGCHRAGPGSDIYGSGSP